MPLHLDLLGKRIYVAGHTGLVGSAIMKALKPYVSVANGKPATVITRSSRQLDLTDQQDTSVFFMTEAPDIVLFAAAKVGGIMANNTKQADFLYENTMMAMNAIHAASRFGVKRFVFLGSSCVYPARHSMTKSEPIGEYELLTAELEPTNEGYAIAKIAGIKLCQYQRRKGEMVAHSLMPCNLYGPGDNYNEAGSHVLPAMIRRFHEAKQQNLPFVTIWGSGAPRREFMHADDLAQAVLHAAALLNPPDIMNVGTGEEITIMDLAKKVAAIVGYEGAIHIDPSRPDGVMQKVVDTTLIRKTRTEDDSQWSPQISLDEGLAWTYHDYAIQDADHAVRQ